MSRDTHLAGSPADLDRVATWLTDVVPATSTFGDEVYGARSATGSAWESEATPWPSRMPPTVTGSRRSPTRR